MQTLEQLQAFAIEGQIAFSDAGNGFPVITVTNPLANATIALQGAHLMTWTPLGAEPVIWVSDAAKLAQGKSIRGGVPLCWPWFGPHESDPKLPGHGHARTTSWRLTAAEVLAGGETAMTFTIEESEQHRLLWPHPSSVEYRLVIGATLRCELTTTNTGTDSFSLSQALHTYFLIGDVERMAIHGLDGCDYIDKVEGGVRKQQHGLVTVAGEVDRIYLGTSGQAAIEDPVLNRTIFISGDHSASTVVWNPWREKADKMGDLGTGSYHRMVCVETANAAEATRTLAPGASHTLVAEYRVEAKG